MRGTEIRIVEVFLQPPTIIWDYFLSKEKIESWWGDVEINQVLGGKFEERWQDKNEVEKKTTGEVIELDHGRKLGISWFEEGWTIGSVVEFNFISIENGTRLELLHKGFDAFPANISNQWIEDLRIGWEFLIGRLKAVVK